MVPALHTVTGGVGPEPLHISEFLCGSQELCSVHKCTAGCLSSSEHGKPRGDGMAGLNCWCWGWPAAVSDITLSL